MNTETHIQLRVQAWVDKDLPVAQSHGLVSIHLDELLGHLGDEVGIEVCQWSMQYLVAAMGAHPEMKAMLHVGLGTSEYLPVTSPATLAEVKAMMAGAEPPSLYLQRRDMAQRPWLMEEYRLPLDGAMFGFPSENLRVFYRAFRCMEAIHGNWEYERGLLVEHFTDELLHT